MKKRMPKTRVRTKAALYLIGALLVLILAWIGGWYFVNYSVYQTLQAKLDLTIQGKFKPSIQRPEFVIRGAAFQWDDKAEFQSGDIFVHYDFLLYFSAKKLKIQLSAKDAVIKLKGSWSSLYQEGPIPVDHFLAELMISEEGVEKINQMHLSSPVFQFHIGDKQTISKGDL
jgi:hypothetical protein